MPCILVLGVLQRVWFQIRCRVKPSEAVFPFSQTQWGCFSNNTCLEIEFTLVAHVGRTQLTIKSWSRRRVFEIRGLFRGNVAPSVRVPCTHTFAIFVLGSGISREAWTRLPFQQRVSLLLQLKSTLKTSKVLLLFPFTNVSHHSVTCRVNVTLGPQEDRVLITGLHTVCDIKCACCGSTLGWKYEVAFEESQKYKEGKFIIEKAKVLKVN